MRQYLALFYLRRKFLTKTVKLNLPHILNWLSRIVYLHGKSNSFRRKIIDSWILLVSTLCKHQFMCLRNVAINRIHLHFLGNWLWGRNVGIRMGKKNLNYMSIITCLFTLCQSQNWQKLKCFFRIKIGFFSRKFLPQRKTRGGWKTWETDTERGD